MNKSILLALTGLLATSFVYADEPEKPKTKLKTVKVEADAEVADGPVEGYRATRSAMQSKFN
ncbi:MAG: hypothetical protein U5M23_02685 [Marinagarivorans sp.]|nr:hypothetical protein [Marinagarivorans sp.]